MTVTLRKRKNDGEGLARKRVEVTIPDSTESTDSDGSSKPTNPENPAERVIPESSDDATVPDIPVEVTVPDGLAEATAPGGPAESIAPDDGEGSTVPNTPVQSTARPAVERLPEVITTLGDVILEIADKTSEQGKRKLLVSSAVLSNASPVFSKMFSGGSYAGHALSTTSPQTVPLPDDDPNSIFLICLITHLKIFKLPEMLNMTDFTNFAHVCHKYSCVEAVHTHSIVWCSFLMQYPEDAGFEKLILATHFLDLHISFNRVTQSIIRDRSAIINIATAMEGHEKLPVDLLKKVKAAQMLSQRQVEQALGALVNEKDACDGFKLRVGTIFHALVSGGMWPLGNQSIKQVRDRLNQVGTPTTGTLKKLCENPNCPCKSASSLNHKVIRKLNQMYADVKGMCLDCAQRDGLTTHQCEFSFIRRLGDCRIQDCPGT